MFARTAALLAVIAAVGAGAYLFWDFLKQDRCLDAGGRWMAEQRRCEF